MQCFQHNINNKVQEDMSELENKNEVCFHLEAHKKSDVFLSLYI